MKQNVTPGMMVIGAIVVVVILAAGFWFTQSRVPPPPPIPNMGSGPQGGLSLPGASSTPGASGPSTGQSVPQQIPGMGGGMTAPGAGGMTAPGMGGTMPGAPPTPGGGQ